MFFASQLCSFPWYLYLYLQALPLAHQQIILERLRAQAPVRTSVSPLCANTTNTQNSINKSRPTKLDQQLAKLSKSNCRKKNRDPEYLVLQKLKHLIALWKNFQKIYHPNNLNAKRNLLLKISYSQTLKLLNEHVRNLLLKIIRTPPQALNKCVRNPFFKIIRTTNFEQLFFKLLRNERISRCAIYFSKLSAKDYSNCITPLRGKRRSVVRAKAI